MKCKSWVMTSLLIAAIGFMGCSDDDDTPAKTDAKATDAKLTGATDAKAKTDSIFSSFLPKLCAEECSTTADCKVSNADLGFECNANKRCTKPGCANDGACTALFSGWTKTCMTDSGCLTGQACVADGGGLCAFQPGVATCAVLQMADYTTTKKDGGAAVTVCANTNYKCLPSGTCGCKSDNACSALTATPTCDTESGGCTCKASPDSCGPHKKCTGLGKTCACTDDQGCGANETCDTFTGICKCANDAACGGRGKCDTSKGSCTCGTASTDCTAPKAFDGTTYVCGGL